VLENLAERVNGNAALVRRGRFLDVNFLIEVGARAFHVRVAAGRIAEVVEGPVLMRPWHFAIRASEEAWAEFWAPVPRPDYHDIFAMTKAGTAVIEGDIAPLMANLRYIKEVLATPRAPTEDA
jgi:hypothetical protein